MKIIFDLVKSPSSDVRRKATKCLGQFAVIQTQAQLKQIITTILDKLKAFLQKPNSNKEELLTHVMCISQISRTVGNKLSEYFNQLVPQLRAFPGLLEESQSVDIDNEISEACLIAIEQMVKKCPQ